MSHMDVHSKQTEQSVASVSAKGFMKLNSFQQAWLELVEGRKAGHMGAFEYANGGMKLWDEFLSHNPAYYVPFEEQALIEMCANMSARLIEASAKKITLVSRGPGTKFEAKEGALLRAFRVAGIDVAKIVYIDVSKPALNQSMREGKLIFPDAEHQALTADIFSAETKNKYSVIGTEVGTCFGLTPMNAYGRHDMGAAPLSAVEENLRGFRSQMRKGSHFIAAFDHNDDKKSIEAAYSGQVKFAKHMLEIDQHLGMDTSDVEFLVEFNEQSRILAHGFKFPKGKNFSVGGRERTILPGTTLWFNNSVKLTVDQTVDCFRHAGFEYTDLEEDNPVIDRNNRFGYHHLKAA